MVVTPYFQTELGQLFNGSALEVLRQLPDESVQCVVTSPPYWNLRDYQVEGQIGLEKTPEEYVSAIVSVFREVRRVLSLDGTVWINLGDTFARDGQKGDNSGWGKHADYLDGEPYPLHEREIPSGFKPKDLCEIPSDVARALRSDGWYLRQRIPWLKKNGMPEAVKDRPPTSVEYVFLLSKSESYFYDYEAVKLPASVDSHRRYARGRSDNHKWADGGPGGQTIAQTFEHMVKVPSSYKGSVPGRKGGPGQDRRSKKDRLPGVTPKSQPAGSGIKANESFHAAVGDLVEKRARRNSDWFFESFQGLLSDEDGDPLAFIVNVKGFSGAHFATFPLKLVEPMILAGSREGDTVLDPFGGACTTGLVAEKLKRRWICIELSPKYCELSRDRINRFLWGETEPNQERMFPKQERLW